MWSKLTHALKPHLSSSTKDEPSVAAAPQGEVMSKVFEQHPNLSMFHPNTNESGVTQPPPGEGNSPSVHSKRNMFKRLSKPMLKDDVERARSPSPFQHSQTLPKKVRNLPEFIDRNDSQSSPVETQEIVRRSSFDMLRPSPPRQPPDTTRSAKGSRKRPSLDLLRQDSPQTSPESMRHKSHSSDSDFMSAEQEKLGSASVRSILRDRNTPGTGQSVRFFSRDAFKVITPDNSQSIDLLEKPQPPLPQGEPAFLEQLAQAAAPSSSTPLTVPRVATSSKPRPKLAGLFSQLDEEAGDNNQADVSDSSFSLPAPSSSQPQTSDPSLFNISQQLDIPQFPPPGLDFNVNAPVFDASFSSSIQDLSFVVKDPALDNKTNRLASPPPLDLKGKGKQQPVNFDESFDEKLPKLPAQLHERSQSFSFGQTVFYSMQQNTDGKSREELESAYPSSDVKPSLDSLDLPSATSSPPFSKVRTRSISDTAFQDMLSKGANSGRPEADINDESSSNLVVYGSSEPDPFSANANTYYTPQVMIPITPPRGAPRHIRKTSKEESVIMSLQTELALKAELCSQYETDLKARDELVEILGKRLSDIEKDESKRKNALKSWKKKVQELERTCRQLEEAMDRSRMESMERSIMDEASGEALRMLHRQIAGLEREKTDWLKREHGLKEEVETLEALVKERSEDVMNLKETLWSRDESDLMLKEGIKEAKEQIDMIGNISMVGVDEDELRRLMAENQKTSEETQRFRIREIELMQELEELRTKYEGVEVQTKRLEEQVEGLTGQLKTKDEEHATLKTELEAQWQHTAKMNEEIGTLEQENAQLIAEKDALKADVESLDNQITNLENQWTDDENKREELETELQEAWNLKDALEQESNRVRFTIIYRRIFYTDQIPSSSKMPSNTNEKLSTSFAMRFTNTRPVLPSSKKRRSSPMKKSPASRITFVNAMMNSLSTLNASSATKRK
ncbi:hypothetical protein CPB83DRAFT_301400 [Crepidotus variabilis]|uniref:Uncharacterized protein n=1 Tax=Crepidotus variabilis TaxID=179855 RepID=A0A9P6JQH5_9AGAR|nr:hypothetical protein CPB83DRAFT_301400 [Crepidotus variabilis]